MTETSRLVTIRDAEEGDLDLLADLNREVQELHVAALPAYFKNTEREAVMELFRSRLSRADVRIWIASAGERPVGHAVAVVRERPENALCPTRRFYEVEELGVVRAHRRQGVGRALIERVLAHARSAGVRDVELTSWAFNVEAHAAFAALGFLPKIIRFGRDSD